MASRRMALIDAAEVALNASSVVVNGVTYTKPVGLTVHRQRKRRLGQDKLPSIVLWLGREPRVYDASEKVQRTTNLFGECRVAHPGQSGDDALDPVLCWAEQALMADITLGGTCEDVSAQETEWDLADESDELARAAIRFEIKHQTKNADPETV